MLATLSQVLSSWCSSRLALCLRWRKSFGTVQPPLASGERVDGLARSRWWREWPLCFVLKSCRMYTWEEYSARRSNCSLYMARSATCGGFAIAALHRCGENRRGRAPRKRPGKSLFGGSNLAKKQRGKYINYRDSHRHRKIATAKKGDQP